MEISSNYAAPEQVGPAFSIDLMYLAQQQSWAALAQIAAHPGGRNGTAAGGPGRGGRLQRCGRNVAQRTDSAAPWPQHGDTVRYGRGQART